MEKVFYIDLNEISTREGLQEAIASALPFPDHYGKNLDALHDSLCEFGSDWNIIFYNVRIARMSLGKYFDALKRLCSEACEECAGLKIRFFS
ncbi:MAG: barstar family protein [Butyrivibrio sp.]|nr:barstar family protein [Butyrivibrio sp.]